MRNKKRDKLMNILLGFAAFAVLLGTLFKIQHYSYGNQIFYFGLMAGSVLGVIEINRLKKIIKILEKEKL